VRSLIFIKKLYRRSIYREKTYETKYHMDDLFNFDPYDAIIQLGRNQEDLYNRTIINNQRVRDLQEMVIQQQSKIADLHKLLDTLLDRVDTILVNTQQGSR
jgi:uncharacterized coiled-coil protein SlyX